MRKGGRQLGTYIVEKGKPLVTIVVGPADIVALAVHLVAPAAVMGATFDVDGGQELVAG